jgi:hypothetical protein
MSEWWSSPRLRGFGGPSRRSDWIGGIVLLGFFTVVVMQVVGFRILAPRGADKHHYTPAEYNKWDRERRLRHAGITPRPICTRRLPADDDRTADGSGDVWRDRATRLTYSADVGRRQPVAPAVLDSERYRPRFRRSALTLSRYPIATIAKSGWAMNVKRAMA